MKTYDLRKGLGTYDTYIASRYPGGELYFNFLTQLGDHNPVVNFLTRLTSSDDLVLLCLAVDTYHRMMRRHHLKPFVKVSIPYMPYQQADRVFSPTSDFGLQTVTKILNSLDVDSYEVYDPHSDVAPALLKNCTAVPNHSFIRAVIGKLTEQGQDLTLLAPDAGAYKKIFKLAEAISFRGQIFSCSKYRDDHGKLTITVPENLVADNILVIDDICVGGATFVTLAEEINVLELSCNLHLAVSHGVFSKGFDPIRGYYNSVFTTDSVFTGESSKDGFLNVHKLTFG